MKLVEILAVDVALAVAVALVAAVAPIPAIVIPCMVAAAVASLVAFNAIINH